MYSKKAKNHKAMENFMILFYISYRNWYPRVILYTILLFQCIDLGPGIYVSVSPNLKCYGAEHQTLLLSLGIPSLLIWSIGVPFLTYYFIKRKRKDIFSGQKSVVEMDFESKKIESKYPKEYGSIYHCLISDYDKKYPYWQVFEFFVLTCCLFISQISNVLDALMSRMTLLLVYGIFFLIYLKLEPFRDGVNTTIMCLSFIICIFTLVFEVIGSNQENVVGVRNFAKNFILAINLLFFFSFLLAMSKRWLEENKIFLYLIGNRVKKISFNLTNSKTSIDNSKNQINEFSGL